MRGQGIATIGLFQPEQATNTLSIEYMWKINYDTEQMAVYVIDMLLTAYAGVNDHQLTQFQRDAYNSIISIIDGERGSLFFLDTPDGTGKTFVISFPIRQMKRISLAVASSGIDVFLLNGGRPAHSSFKLSLDPSKKEKATYSISRGTIKGKLLSECKLIIWNEATMSQVCLRGFWQNTAGSEAQHTTHGGAMFLLEGDFRQTLQVILKWMPV